MSIESLSAEEIRALRRQLDIEAIRKVKMLYSQYMDSGRIDDLAELFTEDAVCEFGPEYGNWVGRETIRTNYKNVITPPGAITFNAMHNICNHWVELTGEATAQGRSYLIDVMTQTPPDQMPIVWFGVYDEAYEKVGGKWLIARCSLQFFWPRRMETEGFVAGKFPG
ncbi:MAG: nuclear transport factor 2 family protein [Pseudomonadales bacterium]|nr:nuclear transport factor 2 family protein [Pseudomonadales bacterium]